jgi:peptidoglycan-associated lipoprotein
MKLTFKHAALFAASFALVACSSVKLDGSQPDANTVKTVDVTNGIGADGVPAPANRTIYFDLDSYVVRPDGQTVVNSQAAFLLKNKSQHVMLQGHTDERGTTEYNIALGQRRSESVRQALALQSLRFFMLGQPRATRCRARRPGPSRCSRTRRRHSRR